MNSHQDLSRLSRLPLFGGLTSLALFLGGCASFTPDAGLFVASTVAQAEINKTIVKVTSDA